MIKYFLVILLLTGCSPKIHTVYETKEVFIPVYSCEKVTVPKQPILPIDSLSITDKSNVDKIAKSYSISVDILKTHVQILENKLKVYE